MSNTSDTDDQKMIEHQKKRLATHRERLAILLDQQAHFGAHVPPHILTGIREAQAALRPIKIWLRTKGISVADEPNDDLQVAIDATPPYRSSDTANQTITNQAPNQVAQGNFYGRVMIVVATITLTGIVLALLLQRSGFFSMDSLSTATLTPLLATTKPTFILSQGVPQQAPSTLTTESENKLLSLSDSILTNDKIRITLSSFSVAQNSIDFTFSIKNEGSRPILVRYLNSYFTIADDVGTKFTHNAEQTPKQRQLQPGENVEISTSAAFFSSGEFGNIGQFQGILSDRTTRVFISISQFMGLSDVKWQIDLDRKGTQAQEPPPGTILTINQEYKNGDISIKLSSFSVDSNEVNFNFTIQNMSQKVIVVRYLNSYFTIADDVGTKFTHNAEQTPKQRQLQPGENVEISTSAAFFSSGEFGNIGQFQGILSDRTTRVFISISQFMELSDLRWEIRISGS